MTQSHSQDNFNLDKETLEHLFLLPKPRFSPSSASSPPSDTMKTRSPCPISPFRRTRHAGDPNASSAPAQPATRPDRPPDLILSTVNYLMRTDVHTFAFSVAANAILSFFPFVVLMMTLIRRVFHSRVMYDVVLQLLRDYLPAGQDFVIRNLNAMVNSRQRVQAVSLVILLVTSSGVFLPLEVALNRVWRFENNRSYLGNQVISFGLAFACGALALLSIALTAGPVAFMEFLLRGYGSGFVRVVGFLMMKLFAMAASIAIFFLIYWLLAQRQSSCESRPARGHHHGTALRSAEVRLHSGAALAQFSGSLRPLRALGEHDVLGISLRPAAAGGSESLGGRTSAAQVLAGFQNSICGSARRKRHASPAVDAANDVLQIPAASDSPRGRASACLLLEVIFSPIFHQFFSVLFRKAAEHYHRNAGRLRDRSSSAAALPARSPWAGSYPAESTLAPRSAPSPARSLHPQRRSLHSPLCTNAASILLAGSACCPPLREFSRSSPTHLSSTSAAQPRDFNCLKIGHKKSKAACQSRRPMIAS